MSWWQPLLDIYQEHLLKCHSNLDQYELHNEYYMKEEFLMYEKFRHAENEFITCDFCTKWSYRYTINFDILTCGEEE